MGTKRIYTAPRLETTFFTSGDVITASPVKDAHGNQGFDGEVDTDF